MTRNLYKLTSHLLPLVAFLFIANVGKGAELDAETKALIAKAEQGVDWAQSLLGVKYALGEGVAQDDKEAVKWYRKSAEQGYAIAQYNLGVMYDKGQGVPQDYKEAVKWWSKAAEQGVAEAQYSLGVMYVLGNGVPKDLVNAYAWLNVASANGEEKASESRDGNARFMTPEQIAKAQELSKVWFEKYQPKN
jgi:TPR repeat protein